MLLVACGVRWNQSLCDWRCAGAELPCLSGEWIKCPYPLPPSMVRFNFRPITGSPCVNTPAAANAYVFLCDTLSYSSHSVLFLFCLSLIFCKPLLCSACQLNDYRCVKARQATTKAKQCTTLSCLCGPAANKADQQLCCLLTESGYIQSATST